MLAFQGLFYMRIVHRNARMAEEIRRIFEVILAVADNFYRLVEMEGAKRL